MAKHLLTCVATSIVLLFLGSCSLAVSSERAADSPILPPTDPGLVQVLSALPEHYVEVGTIRVNWEGKRSTHQVLNSNEISKALTEEAAKLGADAVTDIRIVYRDPGRDAAVVQRPNRDNYADYLIAKAIRQDH